MPRVPTRITLLLVWVLAVLWEASAMAQRWNPAPDARAIVVSPCGKARFTVLTSRLVRMEWSADGTFEDRASQAFVNRRLPVPEFRVERTGKTLRLTTDRLTLSFSSDGKPFHDGNISVRLGVADQPVTWTPASDPSGNLGGTTRTLDGVDGSCPIEPGLVSRDGWAIVDDSSRLIFEPARGGAPAVASNGARTSADHGAASHPDLFTWDWLEPRNRPGAVDWYFFGYGHDYAQCLRDYTLVAGKIPLPPRYVLGSWWSRYWAYSEQDLVNLVGQFREHDVPLDVLVIDMDWHTGPWTGYTWNKNYFPDPARFLKWTDSHGLQITLNLHPADGVDQREDAFPEVCRDMGLDVASTTRVPFDCTSPRYMQSYFRRLHYPLEAMGVDFWWMDWQQGTKTSTPGLDPLWWLNHLHWVDLEERQDAARDPGNVRHGRRPLIFSRWGGLGNHRYPIGFSGDTFSTWPSLAWQPEFTAVAGNVGYAYWSHDIGGHQPGPVDPELYVRWVQYGALSPVLRTHTSKNPLGERRIWASPEREFKAMREAFRLRYRLIPYLYTAARRTFDDATPMCRPLYWAWPQEHEAYEARSQYLLGDDVLAAPVVTPGDRASRCAATSVWIPPGTWTNWFTGEEFTGPRRVETLVPIEEIPMFARGGSIIPLAPKMDWSSQKPLDPLTLIFWPGAESGCAMLYEDDGESAGYAHEQCARTGVSQRTVGDVVHARIEAAQGSFAGMPQERALELRFVDRWPAREVMVDGHAAPRTGPDADHGWFYDEAKFTIVVRLPRASVRSARTVSVRLDEASEAPLRAGLHGQIKMMESLGLLLGDAGTPAFKDAWHGALRRRVIDTRGVGAASMFSADSRWALAVEAARTNAALAWKDEAICRLLGLSCSMSVESDTAAPGRVRTTTSARLLGGLAPADVTLRVSAAPERAWTRAATAASSEGSSASETSLWNAENPPQLTSVRAAVALERQGQKIEVSFSQPVFPSINGWSVVGPFPCDITKSMATSFGPEQDADPARSYNNGGGRTVAWQPVRRVLKPGDDPGAEFVVDLHKTFGVHTDHAVAYARTVLHAERAIDGVLAIGSDDGVAVWVNGVRVHSNDVQRGYGSKQDLVPISLRAGDNVLLLKITQAVGGWMFGAHVQTPSGDPLPGVSVRAQ